MSNALKAAFEELVRKVQPGHAVVLGSGLGELPGFFQSLGSFSQADICSIPASTVAGHSGKIDVGFWMGKPLVVCQGRVHAYEGRSPEQVTALVGKMPEWGIWNLLLFNATGGINPDLQPGDPVSISAYWDASGPNWNQSGGQPVWSVPNGNHASRAEPHLGLKMGRFVMVKGPNYETAAEVRGLQRLGADVVGMSSAWELDAARQVGISVHLVSVIANHACGIKDEPLSHADVCAVMAQSLGRIHQVISRWLG